MANCQAEADLGRRRLKWIQMKRGWADAEHLGTSLSPKPLYFPHNVRLPSVWYEYVLLPLVIQEVVSANCLAE